MLSTWNRTVDEELKIVGSTAFTATGTTTPVAITSIGSGDTDLGIMLNVTALAGTHDASNNFTIEIKAGLTSGGTFYTVESTDTTKLSLGANLLSFNTREVESAVGSANASFYEITVTKVGSTATGATLSAYVVQGV